MRNNSRVIAILVARGRQRPLTQLGKVGGQMAFKESLGNTRLAFYFL